METVKKIVIIGPESTGKSTLCEQLANHFETLWIPEYAREYLEKNGIDYSYEDLLTIAKGQIASEEISSYQLSAMSNEQSAIHDARFTIHPSLLFIDTDMYVMKVWCEFVFNKCHNWILNRIAERKYDCYFLCNIDLEWIKDALREYPDKKVREKLYQYYKDIMINQTVPWFDISGSYDERFEKTVKIIEANNF